MFDFREYIKFSPLHPLSPEVDAGARGDFELLNMAERESVKVRVDQLATWPAEKLAMDYIDRMRRREAERRD